DRVRRLPQVRDVVERIVQSEDIDPVLGRGGDEPADEVVVDRSRPHEQPTAQRQAERSLDVALQGADPLPRALDPPADSTVEAASTRDLEICEAGSVEDLCDPALPGGTQPPRERLLPEQADRRVDKRRHAGSLAPRR